LSTGTDLIVIVATGACKIYWISPGLRDCSQSRALRSIFKICSRTEHGYAIIPI